MEVVNRIYDAVSAKDVASAVRESLRLARLVRDIFKIAEFHFELDTRGSSVLRRLFEDLPDLSEKQLKYLFDKGMERVAEDRTFTKSDVQVLDLGDKSVLYIGAGMLDHEIESCDELAAIHALPTGMTPFDTAAMYDQGIESRRLITFRKLAICRLRDRSLAKCFNFASLIEKQILISAASERTISIIEDEVFAFLRERDEVAYSQLTAAADKLIGDKPEDLSAAALHIRRCMKSVADTVQPADATNTALSEDKYLNRLSFYLESRAAAAASALVLSHTMLEDLLRRLADRASKGVHAGISAFECRQVYIGLMLYLHQIARLSTFS